MLEKILSIIVFEFEVTLVGWIMYGRNIYEPRESENLLVGEHYNHPIGKMFSFIR